jgi:hypothetical protein
MKRIIVLLGTCITVGSLSQFLLLPIGWAQVMSSDNYQLQSDSVNIGGGFSSSSNYMQESTVGEVATGRSDSNAYSLRAGYQQMQEVYMSIAVSSSSVFMDTSLPGITGGESNGTTTVTVTTDGSSGYSLLISAENSPAMQSGVNSIADYNHGAAPDFTFTTNAGEAFFGFSPSGADIVQAFLDNGGTCGVSNIDTPLACWAGPSTTDVQIAEGAGPNHPSGESTNIHFRVELGGSNNVPAGVYIATTTVTAVPL